MNKMPPEASAISTGAPPVALFQGYDSFMSAGRSTAVAGTSQPSGAKAESYYQVCYDYESLQETLNVSSSVSASFGFGSVDAKADFINSLNVTNTSVTIIVYTNILTDAQTVTSVKLTGAPPTDINAFFQAYGDSYLNSLVTGAEYAAAYVFYAQSIEQQRVIQTQLKASGISESGSLSAELQTSLTTAQQNVTTRQSLRQFMSGFKNPIFPPENQIVNFALNFGAKTPDAPAIVSYDTTGYEHVPDMPAAKFAPVIANRDLYDGIGSQPGLADDYATLSAVKNAVLAIDDVYDTYGYTGDTKLTANYAIVEADIKTLDTLFNEIDRDPTLPHTAPSLPALALGTPALNIVLNLQGPWGGAGGDPFDDGVSQSSVSNSMMLAKFSMRGGSWVDQIAYAYAADSGETSFVHGGNGGSQSRTMTLQTGEQVKSISGFYGRFVNQITLTTSFGNMFTWPPSPDGAPNSFSWTQQGSTYFLAFAGRSGEFLDSLSLLTVTFAEARWVTYLEVPKPFVAEGRLRISATAEERARRQRERRKPIEPRMHV